MGLLRPGDPDTLLGQEVSLPAGTPVAVGKVLGVTQASPVAFGFIDPPATANPALRNWHTALANRNYAPAKIALLGDSITEGYYSTSAPARRWSDLLRDRIRYQYPSVGPGTGGGAGWLNHASFYTPWTAVGGGVQLNLGFGRYSLSQSTVGNTASITVTGTSVRLLYTRFSSGGTFSWAVDGGSATNVSTNGTAQDNVAVTIPLGAAGSHTLTLTVVSGACIYNGVVVLNGDENAGIRVLNGGHNTFGTADFVAKDVSVPQGTVYSFCATEQPQLVIIALGLNDWLFQRSGVTSATTYSANLQTLITQVNATTKASIVLMMMYQGGTTTQIAAANPDGWAAYVAAANALAANNTNVSVLDLTQRFPVPSVDNSSGLAYADLLHMSDKGHSYVADLVTGFLAPR